MGARDSQKEDTARINQRITEKVMEGNKEREEKVRVSVTTAGSQDTGRESALNPRSFSMHVTIAVKRGTKQRSASHLKE